MSRRRRSLILILCGSGLCAIIWLDHSYIASRRPKNPESKEQARARDFEKYHAKTSLVINVIDGETIDVDIPDGSLAKTRIRLWGVDTPETKNPKTGKMYFGPEAAEFTEKLVLGKAVTIYLDEANNSRGKYGRLPAYVQLPDKRFLNELLLSGGFAYADLRFRHSFYNRYKQLEAFARSRKEGLWESVTREQLPHWLQRKAPNLLRKN